MWFKRDLRIVDHPVLACVPENMMAIYIFEPKLWKEPDMSYRHFKFLTDSIRDLQTQLASKGIELHIFTNEALKVLSKLHSDVGIEHLWSCQETWNGWTFKRDKTIRKWTSLNRIPWTELPQHGVIRKLQSRDGWAEKWTQKMRQPLLSLETKSLASPIIHPLPTAEQLGLNSNVSHTFQTGGSRVAYELLTTFLNDRGENYTKAMSSPVKAFDACSRLSPHIAFGTISIREIYHSLQRRQHQLTNEPASLNKKKWRSAMRSFSGRLRWHCHFIQKLEDEPNIEFQTFHSHYRNFDQTQLNTEFFDRWAHGQTGYPIVDACMRALNFSGWLNFRMRAMVMSFASHHLQLPWRSSALYLASKFTDYEPGIHYSQCQMQSGLTGINTIRIYNPIKQGYDQDPTGAFIRQWVPELENIPLSGIHEPWNYGAQAPIVNEVNARRCAAERLYTVRRLQSFKREAGEIVKKHGSRRRLVEKKTTHQLKLNFNHENN